jgi:hypothetical protein
MGVLPGRGGVAVGKRQLEPALIVEKYPARVKKFTFETSTTAQIAAQ